MKGERPANPLNYERHVTFARESDIYPEEGLHRLASIVLTDYPEAMDIDLISVTITYGYDIGIARASRNLSISRSPRDWAAIVAKPPP